MQRHEAAAGTKQFTGPSIGKGHHPENQLHYFPQK